MNLFGGRKTSDKDEPATPFLRLMEITREIHGTLDLDRALSIILDGALELTTMQRGFIMLYDEEEKLIFRMGRNNRKEPLTVEDFSVSNTVIQKAVHLRQLHFFNNTIETPTSSGARLQLMCGLCVPLFASRAADSNETDRKIVGALYADSRIPVRFRMEEREIAGSLALHAGLAIENASLFELAVRDGLTRLFQRRYFDSLAQIEWKRTQRHKRPLSLLLLDLDHFKTVNDTYGHAEGDRVLRQTADQIRNCGRTEDIAARYGGEEFVLLLPETDARGAELVAARILETMRRSVLVPDGAVTISIGMATYPDCRAESMEDLVQAADQALYRAKQKGRDRIEGAVMEME